MSAGRAVRMRVVCACVERWLREAGLAATSPLLPGGTCLCCALYLSLSLARISCGPPRCIIARFAWCSRMVGYVCCASWASYLGGRAMSLLVAGAVGRRLLQSWPLLRVCRCPVDHLHSVAAAPPSAVPSAERTLRTPSTGCGSCNASPLLQLNCRRRFEEEVLSQTLARGHWARSPRLAPARGLRTSIAVRSGRRRVRCT